jgi:hypothetical protein
MAKVPGLAKAIAGAWRTVEIDTRLRLRKRLSSSTPC